MGIRVPFGYPANVELAVDGGTAGRAHDIMPPIDAYGTTPQILGANAPPVVASDSGIAFPAESISTIWPGWMTPFSAFGETSPVSM